LQKKACLFSENPNIHCKSARLYWIPEGIPKMKSQNKRNWQKVSRKEIFGMHIFSDYLVCKSLFSISCLKFEKMLPSILMRQSTEYQKLILPSKSLF